MSLKHIAISVTAVHKLNTSKERRRWRPQSQTQLSTVSLTLIPWRKQLLSWANPQGGGVFRNIYVLFPLKVLCTEVIQGPPVSTLGTFFSVIKLVSKNHTEGWIWISTKPSGRMGKGHTWERRWTRKSKESPDWGPQSHVSLIGWKWSTASILPESKMKLFLSDKNYSRV